MQARQLLAIAFRQMSLGRTDLLFDEVKVIQQPLGSGRQLAVLLKSGGQRRAGMEQYLFIAGKARQQLVWHVRGTDGVCLGQATAVQLHLRGTEKLRPQWQFIGIFSGVGGVLYQRLLPGEQVVEEGGTKGFQVGRLFLSSRSRGRVRSGVSACRHVGHAAARCCGNVRRKRIGTSRQPG